MGSFRSLRVWQIALDLTGDVYSITQKGEILKDFGLKDQMRRSAVSIASNIAEGVELGSDKLTIRHFRIARGSTAELITQLIIAQRAGYLSQEEAEPLIETCGKIGATLNKLISIRQNEERMQ